MKQLTMLITLLVCALVIAGSAPQALAEAGATEAPQADHNLSALSDAEAYVRFFALAADMDRVEGKSLLIRGKHQAHLIESTNETAHWLILSDEDECCSVSLTFYLDEDSALDYPVDGAQVELLGLIERFVVGDQAYPLLRVSAIRAL